MITFVDYKLDYRDFKGATVSFEKIKTDGDTLKKETRHKVQYSVVLLDPKLSKCWISPIFTLFESKILSIFRETEKSEHS